MLWENPWGIGVGNAAFAQVYPRYAVSGTESTVHTHQIFLQIGCEMGIPGVAVFLCFLLILAFMIFSCIRSLTGERRGSSLAAGCAVLGCLVMGMFDHIWYHQGMFCLFWSICALATCCGAEKEMLEYEGKERMAPSDVMD